MSEGQGVSELLSERPELEPAVEDALAAAADGPFTFDDLSIDSGAFGELVAAGVVEEGDDGYRVADPEAARAALDGGAAAAGADATVASRDEDGGFDVDFPGFPSVDRRVIGAAAGALLVVVLFRAYLFGTIFRDGAVVLSGNDPYYYRYWVERMLEAGTGAFDLSEVEMPGGIQKGEPLLVAVLWWVTALFGGTADTAGWVMAWYPVVAAVVVAVLTYLTAVAVTADRRIGLAAVVLLAVTPGHAMRTSLGFADHHAFDYVWLALTVYALAVYSLRAGPLRDGKAWLAAAGVAVGVAGQTLAWEAGPLLLVPVGLYVAVRALLDIEAERSPLATNAPLLVGLVVGAAVAWVAHTDLGWHTELVASAPLLLLLGSVAVLAVAELVHRLDLPTPVLAGVELLGLPVGFVVVQSVRPDYVARLERQLTRLLAERNIAETQSLFSGDTFGWLLLFGFVLVLALPYLVWATVRTYRRQTRWAVLVVYGWWLLALASVQVRFVGQLAPLTAIFAGIGFVHLAERVDLTRPPLPFDEGATATDGGGRTGRADRPQRRTFEVPTPRALGALFALFLLVGGLGVVQVPVKMSQITVADSTYETAAWIDDHAAAANESYPDNYVFSPWSRNRVYNYFVSGESQSYGYARSNYASFANATDGTEWYGTLRGRAGYVVTEDGADFGSETLYSRLHGNFGSRTNSIPGVGHFRTIYATDGGDRKVFRPVPGATLTWPSATNGSVTVETDVSVPNAEFTYRRAVTDADGQARVTVAYPGTYTVEGGQYDGATIRINESPVREGGTVAVSSSGS
ncbi:STT3 domain-containing protein [Halorientalis marina]|uniref:STT3 domain-containing protein n=1 Tax=Halorientalis marina TaxID=2931976 RepID=UPI001FF11AB8|nr:STT3 domain-containing protein [Halorientalis marina]